MFDCKERSKESELGGGLIYYSDDAGKGDYFTGR